MGVGGSTWQTSCFHFSIGKQRQLRQDLGAIEGPVSTATVDFPFEYEWVYVEKLSPSAYSILIFLHDWYPLALWDITMFSSYYLHRYKSPFNNGGYINISPKLGLHKWFFRRMPIILKKRSSNYKFTWEEINGTSSITLTELDKY